jgi:hypothetical protein
MSKYEAGTFDDIRMRTLLLLLGAIYPALRMVKDVFGEKPISMAFVIH